MSLAAKDTSTVVQNTSVGVSGIPFLIRQSYTSGIAMFSFLCCPMILGSGLLARAFEHLRKTPDVLVFASGVANSSSAKVAEYARERDLLLNQEGIAARLVYFSTCSLFDPLLKDSGYIRHKLNMEKLIRDRFADHLVLRLPNVVGATPNPHTLCNHIRNCIFSGQRLTVQTKACRFLMGVDWVAEACTPLIWDKSLLERTLNVCWDKPVAIPDLVKAMEDLLQRTANKLEAPTGSCYAVDNTLFKQYWHSKLEMPWPEVDPWHTTLAKYYTDAEAPCAPAGH